MLSSFCDDSNLHISYLYSSKYYPQWGKQGTDKQIFNKNSISPEITHRQSI